MIFMGKAHARINEKKNQVSSSNICCAEQKDKFKLPGGVMLQLSPHPLNVLF